MARRRSRSGRFVRSVGGRARRAAAGGVRRFRARKKQGWLDIIVPISPQLERTQARAGGWKGMFEHPEAVPIIAVQETFGYNIKWGKFDNIEAAKQNVIKSVKRTIVYKVGKFGVKKLAPGIYEWGSNFKIAGRPLWKR